MLISDKADLRRKVSRHYVLIKRSNLQTGIVHEAKADRMSRRNRLIHHYGCSLQHLFFSNLDTAGRKSVRIQVNNTISQLYLMMSI